MAFNPNEPRDLHGKWVHGVGAITKAVQELKAAGKITGAQANAAIKVAKKHAEEHNGEALNGEHPLHKHVEHLAGNIRAKAVEANKNKLPAVAKQRRVEARAVEAVHKAMTGQTEPEKASASPKTGSNKPSAPDEPKVIKQKAAVGKEQPTASAKQTSSELRAQQRELSLSPEARTALKQYATGSADVKKAHWSKSTLSRALRQSKDLNQSQKDRVAAMDKAFEQMPATKAPITLYRGIPTDANGNSKLGDIKPGTVIRDKGYMSTSTSQSVSGEFAGHGGDLLQLSLPAGSHPIDINAFVKGAYGSEKEVLLPRGAQIKITSVDDRLTSRRGPTGTEKVKGRTVHGELILPDLPSQKAETKQEPAVEKVTPAKKPRAVKITDRERAAILKNVLTKNHYSKFKKKHFTQDLERAYFHRRWVNAGKPSEGFPKPTAKDIQAAWADTPGMLETYENLNSVYKFHGLATKEQAFEEFSADVAAKLKGKKSLSEIKANMGGGTKTIKKGEVVIKKSVKMTPLKVRADKVKEGDMLTLPKKMGTVKVTKVTPLASGTSVNIEWERVTHGMGGTNYPSGDFSQSNNHVLSVKRPQVQVKTKGQGNLREQPQAHQYLDTLQTALDGGHDLEELDPANRGLGEGQQTGHVQQLMFDMAVGRQKRGDKPKPTVVPDEEYVKRAREEVKADEIEKSIPYYFKYHALSALPFSDKKNGQLTLPSDADDEAIRKTINTSYSPDFGAGAKQDAKLWLEKHPNASFAQYVQTLPKVSESNYVNEYAVRSVKENREQEVNKKTGSAIKDKVAEYRAKEGTIARDYDIPDFDDVKMKPQSFDDVNSEIDKARGQYVPSFYNASSVEDGVLYHTRSSGKSLDKDVVKNIVDAHATGTVSGSTYAKLNVDINEQIDKHDGELKMKDLQSILDKYFDKGLEPKQTSAIMKEANGARGATEITTGRGLYSADAHVTKALNGAGAYKTRNSKNIDPGYHGSGQIYPGDMLLIQEGGTPIPDEEKLSRTKAYMKGKIRPHMFVAGATIYSQDKLPFTETEAQERIHAAKNIDDLRSVVNEVNKQLPKSVWQYQRDNLPKKKQRELVPFDEEVNSAINGIDAMQTGGKRIEYVPHAQPTQGAPTSQRGRLTLEGYTPQEAAQRLQELGIVGQMEDQVPFDSVMRGPRRNGRVLPLMRDYVRGDAQPPQFDKMVTHGLTGSGAKLSSLQQILEGGGLMSISERFKHGISVMSSSPAGDIRSGIDNVVFCSYGADAGTCGSSSAYRIAMRPEALMRDTVLTANRDFGGMGTRYNHYKRYRDELEAKAGLEVGRKSLMEPLEPKARQQHLDDFAGRSGSSEFNVGYQVPVEDMHAIGVRNKAEIPQVKKILDDMMKSGKIKRRPKVLDDKAYNKEISGTAQLEEPTEDEKLAQQAAAPPGVTSKEVENAQALMKALTEKTQPTNVTNDGASLENKSLDAFFAGQTAGEVASGTQFTSAQAAVTNFLNKKAGSTVTNTQVTNPDQGMMEVVQEVTTANGESITLDSLWEKTPTGTWNLTDQEAI